MRKFTVFAVAMLAVAGFAFGNSIVVPFFLDDGGSGVVPTQGTGNGFIGIVNTSAVDLEMSLIYVDFAGVNRTPTNNTFLLEANKTAAWRPGANDPGNENTAVPNMTGSRDVTGGAFPAADLLAGTCIIYWPGVGQGGSDERAIKGRYVQTFPAGGGTFSYFLGEGRTH